MVGPRLPRPLPVCELGRHLPWVEQCMEPHRSLRLIGSKSNGVHGFVQKWHVSSVAGDGFMQIATLGSLISRRVVRAHEHSAFCTGTLHLNQTIFRGRKSRSWLSRMSLSRSCKMLNFDSWPSKSDFLKAGRYGFDRRLNGFQNAISQCPRLPK